MKAIIVEDEEFSQEYLQSIIQKKFTGLEVVAVADDVQAATAAIKKYQPDLIYLDIEIKMGSGFDVLEHTRGLSYETIFTTAFNSFALEAFRYHAIDYLLKPLHDVQVIEATNRFINRTNTINGNERINALLDHMKHIDRIKSKLSIHTVDGIEFVQISQIVYAEANGNYTDFWLKDGTKRTSSRKLKETEESLPHNLFFRIHHSYLVNLHYVTKYHKGRGGHIELDNGVALPVSSNKKDDFLNWLG
jgi:two-component system LytT family response regulator